jgi:hypothetical protein
MEEVLMLVLVVSPIADSVLLNSVKVNLTFIIIMMRESTMIMRDRLVPVIRVVRIAQRLRHSASNLIYLKSMDLFVLLKGKMAVVRSLFNVVLAVTILRNVRIMRLA